MKSHYLVLLLILSTTSSKEDVFVCEDGPLGEISVKLHQSHHDQAAWFKDVIFPLELEEGSLQLITGTLRPSFQQLCESETADEAWSVMDCTDDLLEQVVTYISKKCSFNDVLPVSQLPLSSNDVVSKWDEFESELKGASDVVYGSGEGEDFMSIGNSTARCQAMRRFTKLSMGQAAPLLGALQPLARGEINPGYHRAVSLLKEFTEGGVAGWRDLAYYALANIEHTVGGGRWDPRAFGEAFERHNIAVTGTFAVAGNVREAADVRALNWMLKIFPTPSYQAKTQAKKPSEKPFKPLFGVVGAKTVESYGKVTVITVVSDDRDSKLDALRASAKNAKVELIVLTTPDSAERWSNDWKPRTLLQHLTSTHYSPNALILFVDGYDVLLSPTVADLGCQLGAGVTFAAERDCWPDAVACRWLTSAPYLNAGVFAGKASDVLHMLEGMGERYGEFAFCGEDQRAYQRYAWDHPAEITLDPHMFQCMHGYSWDVEIEEGLPVVFEMRDGVRVGAAKTPLVLHFNSFDGKQMMDQLVSAMDY